MSLSGHHTSIVNKIAASPSSRSLPPNPSRETLLASPALFAATQHIRSPIEASAFLSAVITSVLFNGRESLRVGHPAKSFKGARVCSLAYTCVTDPVVYVMLGYTSTHVSNYNVTELYATERTLAMVLS